MIISVLARINTSLSVTREAKSVEHRLIELVKIATDVLWHV